MTAKRRMIDSASRDRLQENWQRVVSEVRQAAEANGRDGEEIKIVGVSKYVDAETTEALFQAGCRDLGESRPQQLWQKAESLSLEPRVQWHLIGHLQRNKIRRTLQSRPVIHSVDSVRLLQAIAAESVAQNDETHVLLEVNISGDRAKTGFDPNELDDVLSNLPEKGIQVDGLMAMAGWGTDAADARRQFAQTRLLRDRLQQHSNIALEHLSMGMSGDFAEAIAEGATMVRIGSRLYEGID